MNHWNPDLAIKRSEDGGKWCVAVNRGHLIVGSGDGETRDIDDFIDELRALAKVAAGLNR